MIQKKLHAIGIFISDDKARQLDDSISLQSRLMLVPVAEIENNIVRLLTPVVADAPISEIVTYCKDCCGKEIHASTCIYARG